MLCMLLVMLLAFSTVSIGASAAYTSYASPTSYDIHETPVLSTAQRGSQLLDYVDAMLYDMRDDLYIDITIMTLDFTSVDKALDTIAGLKSAANLIGGDVGDLDIDALGSTRRGTAGKTDLDILYELLYFLNANRGIVGNFVKGELDLGLAGSHRGELNAPGGVKKPGLHLELENLVLLDFQSAGEHGAAVRLGVHIFIFVEGVDGGAVVADTYAAPDKLHGILIINGAFCGGFHGKIKSFLVWLSPEWPSA